MIRRIALLLPLVLGAACSKKLEGPTPQVNGVSPATVCQSQLTTTVTVSGSGLSPLVTGHLEDPRLELPSITLSRTRDLAGQQAQGRVTLPDDPSNPGESRVRWLSQEQMAFDVYPALGLEPGLYDVELLNSNGQQSTFAGGLLAVPPPSISSVVPDIGCADQGNVTLTITGTGFLKVDGAEPTVQLGTRAPISGTTSGCTAITGLGEAVELCTTLVASVPQGTPAGAYPVVVKNPAPAGCSSVETATVTLFSAPTVTALIPESVCRDADEDISVEIQGTGFVVVSANGTPSVPTVAVGAQLYPGGSNAAPTPGSCTPVMNTRDPVQVCTSLTISVRQGSFTELGSEAVVVTNPAPVGCSSAPNTAQLEITPPPTISALEPTTICSSGGQLQLSGTGFASNAEVQLQRLSSGTVVGTVDAQSVTVTGDGTQANATFAQGLATGDYRVELSNPDGCSAQASTQLTVVPGPQVFFVDPNIIYNAVAIQATVYGTGFTLPIPDDGVKITHKASGTTRTLTITDQSKPNQVQVIIPQGLDAGAYDLSLKDATPTCVATLDSAIEVVSMATLALEKVEPPFGAPSEDTAVTVTAAPDDATATFLPVPRVYLSPPSPGPGTLATALGAVSQINEKTLTALVPAGLNSGTYDLIVVNPDKRVGFLPQAFTVTTLTQPPPTITTLSPGSLPNTGSVDFDIIGNNFRSPQVTLDCFDATGAAVAAPTSSIMGTPTATKITVRVGATSAAACVVRVTNPDNETYADFSALVFTNPAKNLYAAQPGPNLGVARRAPVFLGGDATGAARFLYVIGGDDGSGTGLASVESAPLGLRGVPGTFSTQRTTLTQGRTYAAGARIGRWLYVAGGSNAGTALDTVERAYILDPNDRGRVTELVIEIDDSDTPQGLGGGIYYYRVAAVMPATDPLNPGGENLATDPFPVQLPDISPRKVHVTVKWEVIPGAASYRVYRSPTVGAAVGTEQIIGEVPATQTSFKDTGLAPIPDSPNPLTVGALGQWHLLKSGANDVKLSIPREGPGVSWAIDPAASTTAYLYVLGGRQSANQASNTYEYLPLTLGTTGSQTPAASFVSGGTNTFGSERWQLGAARATHELSPVIPAGETWLYVISGIDATGAVANERVKGARVQAGGALESFIDATQGTVGRAGYFTTVAADLVFAFGGATASPDNTIASGPICGSAGTSCATNNFPPYLQSFNTGQNMREERYLMGGVLHGAFIYVGGGVTSLSPLTVTNTTEYRIW